MEELLSVVADRPARRQARMQRLRVTRASCAPAIAICHALSRRSRTARAALIDTDRGRGRSRDSSRGEYARTRARAAHRGRAAAEVCARRGPRRRRSSCSARPARPRLRASGSAGMQDDIIRAAPRPRRAQLYRCRQPVRRPSAWRWSRPAATAAALLAPGSDIDLLFLLPYKQTAWGECVAEAFSIASGTWG